MDRVSHAAANVSIGNDAGAAAFEVSVGGLVLEVDSGAVTLAVAGGDFEVEHNGSSVPAWSAFTVWAGDRLAVRPGRRGSWAYVAVAGQLDVPTWLGHSATHSTSGFGGGVVGAGREFDVASARVVAKREGEIPMLDPVLPSSVARVVVGPQDHRFEPAAVEAFTASSFTLTGAYDRMGVRLDGPRLSLSDALSIPSEPIVRGSVQVTGDGVATVLLADHQTTGGYPKIATVISPDLDRFCQLRPGDAVSFEPLEPAAALEAARADARRTRDYLSAVSGVGRTLGHRLREQNLIGGAVSPIDDVD